MTKFFTQFRRRFGGAAAGFLTGAMFSTTVFAAGNPEQQCGKKVDGLPEYLSSEVASHQAYNSSVWVTYHQGVYDVTKFLSIHPGGEKRLMDAAGRGIEPFWELFPLHFQPHVKSILEQYRIGNLKDYDEEKVKASLKKLPWVEEDAKPYCLEVSGEGLKTDCFSLFRLKTEFPQETISAGVVCNGRVLQEGQENNWKGVTVRDLLIRCSKDKIFSPYDRVVLEGIDKNYIIKLPIQKALNFNTTAVVATHRDGVRLNQGQGFPARAMVPVDKGAETVKWMSAVRVEKGDGNMDIKVPSCDLK